MNRPPARWEKFIYQSEASNRLSTQSKEAASIDYFSQLPRDCLLSVFSLVNRFVVCSWTSKIRVDWNWMTEFRTFVPWAEIQQWQFRNELNGIFRCPNTIRSAIWVFKRPGTRSFGSLSFGHFESRTINHNKMSLALITERIEHWEGECSCCTNYYSNFRDSLNELECVSKALCAVVLDPSLKKIKKTGKLFIYEVSRWMHDSSELRL